MTCILSFNINKDILPKLGMLCTFVKVPLKIIDKNHFGCTLAQLVSGRNGDTATADTYFDEPMLVMANLSKAQFDLFLNGMKRFGLPKIPLKAVLTEYNAEWSAVKLYRELCAERDAVENGKTLHRT